MQLSDLVNYSPFILAILSFALAVFLQKKISTTGTVMLVIAGLMFIINGVVKYVDFSYSKEASIGSYIFAVLLLTMVVKDTSGVDFGLSLTVLVVSLGYLFYEGYEYFVGSSASSSYSAPLSVTTALLKKPIQSKKEIVNNAPTCKQIPPDMKNLESELGLSVAPVAQVQKVAAAPAVIPVQPNPVTTQVPVQAPAPVIPPAPSPVTPPQPAPVQAQVPVQAPAQVIPPAPSPVTPPQPNPVENQPSSSSQIPVARQSSSSSSQTAPKKFSRPVFPKPSAAPKVLLKLQQPVVQPVSNIQL
jgi:hypothetical protein